jgi:hypothetical protein
LASVLDDFFQDGFPNLHDVHHTNKTVRGSIRPGRPVLSLGSGEGLKSNVSVDGSQKLLSMSERLTVSRRKRVNLGQWILQPAPTVSGDPGQSLAWYPRLGNGGIFHINRSPFDALS